MDSLQMVRGSWDILNGNEALAGRLQCKSSFLELKFSTLASKSRWEGWRVARIFTAFSKAKEASRSSADTALESQVLDLEPILITINCQFAESG